MVPVGGNVFAIDTGERESGVGFPQPRSTYAPDAPAAVEARYVGSPGINDGPVVAWCLAWGSKTLTSNAITSVRITSSHTRSVLSKVASMGRWPAVSVSTTNGNVAARMVDVPARNERFYRFVTSPSVFGITFAPSSRSDRSYTGVARVPDTELTVIAETEALFPLANGPTPT